jgi:hypothetical protein
MYMIEREQNACAESPSHRTEEVVGADLRHYYLFAHHNENTPFIQRGGLGKAYTFFGTELPIILKDLHERLAA